MPTIRRALFTLLALLLLLTPTLLPAAAQGDGDTPATPPPDEPLDHYTDPALEVYMPLPEGWDATRVQGGNEPILFITNGELSLDTLTAAELGDTTTLFILGEQPIEGAPVSDQLVAIENVAARLQIPEFIGEIEEKTIDGSTITIRESAVIEAADARVLFIATTVTEQRLVVAYVRFGSADAYADTRATVEAMMAGARAPSTAELAEFRLPVEPAALEMPNLYVGDGFAMEYSDDFVLTTDATRAGAYLELDTTTEFLRNDTNQTIVVVQRLEDGSAGTALLAIESLVPSVREDILGTVGLNIAERGAYMVTGGIIEGDNENAYEYRNIAMLLEDDSVLLLAVYDISEGLRSLDPVMPEVYAMLASVMLSSSDD